MVSKLGLAALALVLFAIQAHAQDAPSARAQDAPLAITIDSSTSSPHSCGRVSYPLYCYGIPISVNNKPGTLWLDVYYNTNSGFALFNVENPDGTYAFLSTANITGVKLTFGTVTYGTHTSLQITSTKVGLTFTGDPDGDADKDSSTAVLTQHFAYSYGCSGGRGYSCFWVQQATGGSITGDAGLR